MSEFDEHIIGSPQFYHESKVLDADRRTAVSRAAASGVSTVILTGFSADMSLAAGPSAEKAQTMTHQAIEAATNSDYRAAALLGAGALGFALITTYNMMRAIRLEGVLAAGRLSEADKDSLIPAITPPEA